MNLVHNMLYLLCLLNLYSMCRMYARRRVRDYLKEKKGLEDAMEIAREYRHGLESLEMLQRQVKFSCKISLHLS